MHRSISGRVCPHCTSSTAFRRTLADDACRLGVKEQFIRTAQLAIDGDRNVRLSMI
jgi:hypothetical protein